MTCLNNPCTLIVWIEMWQTDIIINLHFSTWFWNNMKFLLSFPPHSFRKLDVQESVRRYIYQHKSKSLLVYIFLILTSLNEDFLFKHKRHITIIKWRQNTQTDHWHSSIKKLIVERFLRLAKKKFFLHVWLIFTLAFQYIIEQHAWF